MPDNGGARRGLVCPDGAETHFRRRAGHGALSAFDTPLFPPPPPRVLFFRFGIFCFASLYHAQAKNATVLSAFL